VHGYLRRGIEHAKVCPECGARGFHGDLVVRGEPEAHRESRGAGCVAHVARSTTSVLFVLSATGWIVTRVSVWSDWSSIGVIAHFGIALAIWIRNRIRRQNAVAAGGIPTIMLCGSSAVRRTAVDAIKHRVAAAQTAS
jgi:hypothetical protein